MKNAFIKGFYNATRLQKLFYILTIVISILLITNYGRTTDVEEGFTAADAAKAATEGDGDMNEGGGLQKFTMKSTPSEIYDNFYVNIYDALLFSNVKNNFEIGTIVNDVKPTTHARILDIGCGVGHQLNDLVKKGFKNVQGIDISRAMIKKAKETYPQIKFTVGNAMEQMLYPAQSFNLILCLYFTLYYLPNKPQFFQNCMIWLQPGGTLVLHVVDHLNFDPIIPAGDPFTYVSPQNYVKERITRSVVKFDEFDYRANFNLKDGDGLRKYNATLSEVFKKHKDNGNGATTRKNEHQLYMPSENKIIKMAKAQGFIVQAKVDMIKCQYANQFLYILQKPS